MITLTILLAVILFIVVGIILTVFGFTVSVAAVFGDFIIAILIVLAIVKLVQYIKKKTSI